MRIRGETFWLWADPGLHHRNHDEVLENGLSINVEVRLSRTGGTQMFMGIYSVDGEALYEEAFDSRPGESMSKALAVGTVKARQLAVAGVPHQGRRQRSR